MRRLLVAFAIVASLFSAVGTQPAAGQDAPYIIVGMFPGEPGVSTPQFSAPMLDAFYGWTGKAVAASMFFANHWDSVIAGQISSRHSIPVWSWAVLEDYNGIAAGSQDTVLLADIAQIRTFVQGPNLILGDGDDRRVYIRLAYEANVGIPWSPCHPSHAASPTVFKDAWRHIVDLYRNAGLDSTRVAFMYSMVWEDGAGPNCTAANLYPGDAYVDWTGIDGYAWNGRNTGQTPAQIFGPMATTLRTIAPSKPLAITEVGVDPIGFAKPTWITDVYDWAKTNDVRFVSYFNVDRERPWGVFGGEYAGPDDPPNETYVHCTLKILTICVQSTNYTGYSTYRQAIQQPISLGSNGANPRLLTDAQFLGQ